MSGAQTQFRRHLPSVQGPVVDGPEPRLVPDAPARLLRPPAKIDVLVIEKEVLVKAADIADAVATKEQAAPSHPRHPAAPLGVDPAVFPSRPRQAESGQRAQERREPADRELPRPVGMAQMKADGAR